MQYSSDLHVGSGCPTTINSWLRDESDYASTCASMCSAASTVASALNSMESTSFPATHQTSVDLANKVAMKFLKDPPSRNRKRTLESENEWERSASPRSIEIVHPTSRCRNCENISKMESCDRNYMGKCIDGGKTNSTPEITAHVRRESDVEEFSLGSGTPYACSEAAFLLLLINKKSS